MKSMDQLFQQSEDFNTKSSNSSEQSLENQKKYQEAFEVLKADLESDKIGSHYFPLSSATSIFEKGVYSLLDRRIEHKRLGEYDPHEENGGGSLQAGVKLGFNIFEHKLPGYIETLGKEYVQKNFADLLKKDLYDDLPHVPHNSTRKERNEPRLNYFIENILPNYLNYYLEHGEWENETELYTLVDRYIAEGLVSTIPPEETKELFNKRQFVRHNAGHLGIMFNSFEHPLMTQRQSFDLDNHSDLGVAGKIKPYRFRAVTIPDGNYNKENNTFTWGLDIWNSEEKGGGKENYSGDAIEQYIKAVMKELESFQKNKHLPVLDSNYNLVPDLNTTRLEITGRIRTSKKEDRNFNLVFKEHELNQ